MRARNPRFESCPVSSTELGRSKADMMDAWRSFSWRALPSAFGRSKFELDLVSDRNTEVTDGRDLGPESLACFVHGSRTERGEVEAAALIEAKRLEIVVRRHEPDTFAVADLLAQCIEECAPDALLSLKHRNVDEFPAPGLQRVAELVQ
jgi:hypothetical protein